MKLTPCFSRTVALGTLALLLSGCGNIFIPKHKVLVDAIASAGQPKPAGQSYRLVGKKSVVGGQPGQVSVVKACVDAALMSNGMFEAPANAAPDVVIEVGFGQDSTPRVDPASRETYLQLSARANPTKLLDRATGEEVWDVRVSVLGIAGRMETAMPLLASVAASYIGADTKVETRIEIPQNAPQISQIRETAIKTLDAKNPGPAAAAAASGTAGTTAATSPASGAAGAPVTPPAK